MPANRAPSNRIDEIDKKSYDTHDTGVRKRARAVFTLLARTLTQIEPDGRAVLNNGETVIDVLRDEPGHIRLPNNDDEIVARACLLQQAHRPSPGHCHHGGQRDAGSRPVLGG